MIKTGVYGLIRTLLWLPPAEARFPSGSWGMAVATLGAVTLFVGTAQALKQEHTKRLLAFHSIGQVGYILLGLGACVALAGGLSVEARSLALLGLIGALFHTFNHATFKSLLFLNAGAILSATDTQDINRLGGLMRHMPVTGWTALVASLSIAGVPAFNGFASKWSIFVASVLASPHQRGLVLLGLVAILTSALTLASFLKFYGMTFLSRSSHLVRERSAARSLEVDALMKAPQVLLAALCVVVGLVPGPVLRVLARSIPDHSLALVSALGVASLPSGTLQVSVVGNGQAVAAVLFPAAFFALLAALLLFSRWVSRLGGARRREAPVWLCGYLPESDETRYRAHGLYGEIKGYVGWVGGRGPAGAHPAPARDASPHEKE
jgi:formate hydrogenlyase subunit 3/multisubunit Na+/H+ antiporter MnhD subunit